MKTMKNFSFNFKESFSSKSFKYGGYAALMIAFMLGVLIAVNLVVEQIPVKFDLSQNKLFSLSKQTVNYLAHLDQDIDIYTVYGSGKDNTMITEILKKYSDRSRHIHIKTVDPAKNPAFIRQFVKNNKTLSEGSLIIARGKTYKVIESFDLFQASIDQETMEQQIVGLAAEQRITGALVYVNQPTSPVIYSLEGHGEVALPLELTNQLEAENYQLKTVSLLTHPVPGDASILLLYAPGQDLTKDETAKIQSFLANHGRAIFLLEYTRDNFPNLQSLLNSYGITLERQIVVEGDSTKYFNSPVYLLPNLGDHQILASLKDDKMPVLLPAAQSIKNYDIKKETLVIEPLITSSKKSWSKNSTILQKVTSENPLDLNHAPNDPAGPFNLAVAVTNKSSDPNDTKDTKLIVVGSAGFLNPEITTQVPGNSTFFLNSLGWLQDRQENLSIPPKSLLTMRLQLNSMDTLLLSGLVIIVIPLLVLGTGLVIWLRRRHL